MRLVKTDLRGISADDLLVRARVVKDRMSNNPLFPLPAPSMAEFGMAIDELNDANVAALDRGRMAVHKKRTSYKEVATMLKRLAGYVASVSGGDIDIVMSGGFELRKRSTRIAELSSPQHILFRNTAVHGQTKLRWKPVHGARMYNIRIKPVSGAVVQLTTSSSRHTFNGLITGEWYSIEIEAVGASGKGPKSGMTMFMAA